MKKYLILLVIFIFPVQAFALTGDQIMQKYLAAFYYPGNDFKAKVMMKLISAGGEVRSREMTMIRKNYGPVGGKQKYFIYFWRPSDVRNMTFMVFKHPGRNADRWLFVPALNMVRRIAAQDKYSSFVGSDFSYDNVSGRPLDEDTHTLIKEDKIGSRDCYVVKNTPKAGDADYNYRLSWIDKKTFLPIKEEYFDKRNELYKVFTADKTKDIDGFPTVVKQTMKNVQSGHTTVVTYEKIDYNVGVSDSLFSERFMQAPPMNLIQ